MRKMQILEKLGELVNKNEVWTEPCIWIIISKKDFCLKISNYTFLNVQ